MYIDENIKKLVEDAIKNMDPNGEFFKNVVSQITEQIKNEQKKIEQDKISTPKISKKLGDKADTYLTNNKSLDEYISNRDKFMGVFEKITKDKIKEDVNQLDKKLEQVKESLEDLEKNNSSNNISYTSYTSGWKQTTNEDGKPIGYLYFNFNSNSDHPDTYKQILDYYSILTLHADEWDNWELFHYDYNKEKFHLSVLIDDFTYTFDEKESEMVDNNEDDITSFIYTKLDDELKMFSIYMLNYSSKTNKLYDFIRIIVTVPDEITEPDYNNYYINLENYFSDKQRLINLLEDYTYTFINRFKVNHHLPVKEEKDMYVLLQGDILKQIKDKMDSESKKIDSIDDKFILNRIDVDKSFDFLKDFFDYDDNEYIINTGNKSYDDFLSKAINDGYIEVEFLSPERVYLNINGTSLFMNNPYNTLDS